MAEKILEIQHLKKSYGQNEVLKDISLTVEKGEVISIIGSSGSGKSTFLRSINLLETPTDGVILSMILPTTVRNWGWFSKALISSKI